MFPEFVSLKKHPWNCKPLSPADHLVAHYYLYRALPKHPVAYLSFLKMCSHSRFNLLAQSGYDEALLREISSAFARMCAKLDSIDGWLHVYKGKSSRTIIPANQLQRYLDSGWTQTAPPRQWVFRGSESYRVPTKEVPAYLEQGYQIGRAQFHTKESRRAIRKKTTQRHEEEKAKGDNAYSYMPRGEEHWLHGKERDEKTKGKIRKKLTGIPKPPEHPVHQGLAKGKHWNWSEEAKQKLKDSGARLGENNPWYGTLGPMGGKFHSEETKEKMSESHKEFYTANPNAVAALDAARPRREQHWTYGKERDAATRDKISRSLEGKTQSEATKLKRSESLKAFHAKKKADKTVNFSI